MKYMNAWHLFRSALEAEFVGKIILSNDGVPFKVSQVVPQLEEMDGYVEISFYDNGNHLCRRTNEKDRLPEIWPENFKV